MRKKLTLIIASIVAVVGLGFATPVMQTTSVSADAKTEIEKGVKDAGGDQDTRDLNVTVKTVINVMLFIIGILSVIMIIYGGIRYVISTGDATKVTNAKNTIIYAVVGLVIAIMAYAIVNWVLKSV